MSKPKHKRPNRRRPKHDATGAWLAAQLRAMRLGMGTPLLRGDPAPKDGTPIDPVAITPEAPDAGC